MIHWLPAFRGQQTKMVLATSTSERERGWFYKDIDVKQRYQIKTSKIGVCPYDIPPKHLAVII